MNNCGMVWVSITPKMWVRFPTQEQLESLIVVSPSPNGSTVVPRLTKLISSLSPFANRKCRRTATIFNVISSVF